MSRCRWCAGPIAEERQRLRGHRRLFCCDDHHDRDDRAQAAAYHRRTYWPKVKRRGS